MCLGLRLITPWILISENRRLGLGYPLTPALGPLILKGVKVLEFSVVTALGSFIPKIGGEVLDFRSSVSSIVHGVGNEALI